ncbi:MAG: hypothetical protein KC434_18645 [Anaerolineales bacterium]|nr:hypothetical protein [Anaerolineales bacterium]
MLGMWISGAALIIIGLAFLLRNSLHWSLPGQWWAVFLLIPAVSSLAAFTQPKFTPAPHRFWRSGRRQHSADLGRRPVLEHQFTTHLAADSDRNWHQYHHQS